MSPSEVPLNDDDLVTRARAGDLEAYELLVARHTASAYRTAVLLGAGPDAEDVIQEAFVKGHRKISRYRGEASFRSWPARRRGGAPWMTSNANCATSPPGWRRPTRPT
ncbi:sigma factor [Micromonospora sp. NPDC049060]|uniref:RNA polymerase sigma factor n=1 Tax=Micromonospora sp. NPDC049060 TaxID=3154828 RepID=UPI0033D9A1D5